MRLRARIVVLAVAVGGLWLLLAGIAHASAEESCFTSKINGARAAAGRGPLAVRSDLVSIARRHSARMASSGTIYHNGNLANEAPNDWQSLGENVGMGPNCNDIHSAFMNSASHKKNILDPDFNYVGVGVVIAADGTIFVTEVFMQAPSQAAPATTTTTTKTTTTTTAAPRPRTTTARRTPQPAAVPAAPAEPPPPPPPPPGSKVKGEMAAYFDLLEKESEFSDEARAEYQSFLQQRATEAVELRRRNARQETAERNLLARVASYIGGALSAGL